MNGVKRSYPRNTGCVFSCLAGYVLAVLLFVFCVGVPYSSYAQPPIPKPFPPKPLPLLKPDLTIVSLTLQPSHPTTESLLRVTAVIKNVGLVKSGPCNLQFWIGGSSKPVVYRIPPLEPGKTVAKVWQGRLKRALNYRIRAVVDSDREVKESREDNNQRHIDFKVSEPPTLKVVSVTSPFGDHLNIIVTFNRPVNKATVNSASFLVYGPGRSRPEPGTFSWTNNRTVNWTSMKPFRQIVPSEGTVVVKITDQVKGLDGRRLDGDADGRPGGTYEKRR